MHNRAPPCRAGQGREVEKAPLRACIQGDHPLGQNEDCDGTADDLLDITPNDGNLYHDPHQQPREPWVLGSATESPQSAIIGPVFAKNGRILPSPHFCQCPVVNPHAWTSCNMATSHKILSVQRCITPWLYTWLSDTHGSLCSATVNAIACNLSETGSRYFHKIGTCISDKFWSSPCGTLEPLKGCR